MPRFLEFYRSSFPPRPKYTEKDYPDQAGKVFVVTGATAGVGQALTKILYSKNAKIYLATRSASKTAGVISAIKAAFPNSTGSLMHLQLDLNDLAAVKSAADELLATEPHIDVLWNNAGVMMAPIGQTAQGHEIHLGVNCLAHFLFAKLLTPLLRQTAETKEPGSVRVVWLSSIVSDYLMPRGGVPLGNLDFQAPMYQWQKYGVSKAGNYYLATEYARRHGLDGIVSMPVNPGNLATNLDNHSWLGKRLLRVLCYEAKFGAYTELFAGLHPEVTLEKSGEWVVPWGRFGIIRQDQLDGSKSVEEGGTGVAEKFWEWCEEQVQQFV